MENSFDMLSETERSVYESLPVPLAVLYAESGHFRLLAASDGAITLIGWTRELTRQHADDPLQLVWEDDRDMVRTQCEYALMYPGDESRTTPRMKTASAAVKVCCRARARHLKNVSCLLFLTFSDASEDPCRAPDRQDGSLSAALTGVVADPEGNVYGGPFIAGANPVCVTFEVTLEEWLPA